MATDLERLIRREDKNFITVEKAQRSYLYYVPQNLSSNELISTMMILHGGGANAENAMRMANAEHLADEYRCLLLYPDGYGHSNDRVYTWNAGNCCGLAKEDNSDDVMFLKHLLKLFAGQFNLKKDRVMVAGFSNGAMMAHRFAIEAPECVSAIATISGGMNYHQKIPTRPVSVLSMHGLLDTHAPYKGGLGKDTRYPRKDQAIEEGIQKWARWNGSHSISVKKICGGEVQLTQFTQGSESTVIHDYIIQSQGHAWPGGRHGLRYGNVDEPFKHLNASKIIYDFMEQHPRITAL